ncbi:MAG: hypothetical protein K2O00_07275 [Muribaculaceae bacterium]|nr:hypothetical protein [Muribaculaceae bacterium]
MKNIIIKKEWIEILESYSTELRDMVMGAIYDFALRGKEPENLKPEDEIAYRLIKTEMLALDESLDFDGAREAAIRKKRAAERRAAKAAEKLVNHEKEFSGSNTGKTNQLPSSSKGHNSDVVRRLLRR